MNEMSEARARWVCCPMCDKKKCDRTADDCDVKIYLKNKAENEVNDANTIVITFQTPQGRQVKYIKCDVLDKIKAEIIELRSRQNVGVMECLDIIDKYMSEKGVQKEYLKSERSKA